MISGAASQRVYVTCEMRLVRMLFVCFTVINQNSKVREERQFCSLFFFLIGMSRQKCSRTATAVKNKHPAAQEPD